eukprot:5395955-Alexandrium_andersonii.AAC.1
MCIRDSSSAASSRRDAARHTSPMASARWSLAARLARGHVGPGSLAGAAIGWQPLAWLMKGIILNR